MADNNDKTILDFISWNLKILAQSHERIAKAMEEHNEILREQNGKSTAFKSSRTPKKNVNQSDRLFEMLNRKPGK